MASSELKDLPAGTYTIVAWHENSARRTSKVTLGEKEIEGRQLHVQARSHDDEQY